MATNLDHMDAVLDQVTDESKTIRKAADILENDPDHSSGDAKRSQAERQQELLLRVRSAKLKLDEIYDDTKGTALEERAKQADAWLDKLERRLG